MFGRLGLDSVARLKDLYEPAGLRAMRDTLARILSEQSAFAAALPKLASPWARIDWARMQRLVGRTAELAETAEELAEAVDGWDVGSIPPEDQAELAEAMRPVAEAVEGAAATPEDRENKQLEAITRLMALQEALLAKHGDLDERIGAVERKRVPLWVRVLMKVLEVVVLALVIEWAASHVTPAIDRALGLLNEPVSSAIQPSAIRRDAAEAIAAVDLPVQDARYLRVVTWKSLRVFAKPEDAEPCIHRLRSGQVVAIVEWAKQWHLVAWRDAESGELRSGWVRAKYIAKIKR